MASSARLLAATPLIHGEHPDPSKAETLWTLLDGTWFAAYRMREIELGRFGLTIEQSAILKILSAQGGSATTGVLEYLTMRQPNSISTLVNRISKTGLLDRERNGAKKRDAVSLTPRGKSLLTGVTETSIEEVFACMSRREIIQLFRMLRILEQRALSLLQVPFMRYLVQDGPETDSQRTSESTRISAENAWSLLDRTRFIMARLRELELAQFGLTIEQSAMLKILHGSGGSATARRLEEMTLRQHHSVSTLVSRMVRMGLLARVRNKNEKSHVVYITSTGLDLLNSLTNLSVSLTFSALKDTDKERMEAFLRRLGGRARSLLAPPSPH